MAELVAVILIVVVFLAAIAWRLREGVRARHAVRDDTRRAGEAIVPSSSDAARHAEGTTAWTRISGP